MQKCFHCDFENEEGALFCEQCKTDLGSGQPVAVAEVVEKVSDGDVIPVAGAAEDTPGGSAGDHLAAALDVPSPAGGDGLEAPPPLAVPSPDPERAPPLATAPAALGDIAAPAISPLQPDGGAETGTLPREARPRLLVLRGLKLNVEYPLYEGLNFIGRADEKPVDIDLEDQEPPDRIWSSRQHAVISMEGGQLMLEDLSSSNGTFVNRTRIYPSQKQPLHVNDVIQIGTVQMKVLA